MKKKILMLFATAFLIISAIPVTVLAATPTTLDITISDISCNEGASENWQDITGVADFTFPTVPESCIVGILARDVDAPEEFDNIRIKNVTQDTQFILGNLTGMDGEDNTTAFEIPVSFINTTDSYRFEMDMSSYDEGVNTYDGGWVVTIKNITVLIDGGEDTIGITTQMSGEAGSTAISTTTNLSNMTPSTAYT